MNDRERHDRTRQYVSTAEAARILGVDEQAVRRALAAGRLRGVQLAERGPWRVLAADLQPARSRGVTRG